MGVLALTAAALPSVAFAEPIRFKVLSN